jgi:hypothetical protein
MVLVSNSIQELQDDFNDVHNWLQKNCFIINRNKAVVMEENWQKATSAGMARG